MSARLVCVVALLVACAAPSKTYDGRCNASPAPTPSPVLVGSAAVAAIDTAVAQAVAGPQPACSPNLCGMDIECWCHEAGGDRRCWSQPDDCGDDFVCCVGDASGCVSQGTDSCSKAKP